MSRLGYEHYGAQGGDWGSAVSSLLGQWHTQWGTGYQQQQSTKPQTLGYGLVDSPVGQLAWVVEKFWAWTDCDGDPYNHQGPAARQRNCLLVYGHRGVIGPPLLGERRTGGVSGAGDPGQADGTHHRADRLLGIPARDPAPVAALGTSQHLSSQKFSSMRSDHRSCRCERRCDSGSGTGTRRPASRSPGRRGERSG
jgi:hypothetical protein